MPNKVIAIQAETIKWSESWEKLAYDRHVCRCHLCKSNNIKKHVSLPPTRHRRTSPRSTISHAASTLSPPIFTSTRLHYRVRPSYRHASGGDSEPDPLNDKCFFWMKRIGICFDQFYFELYSIIRFRLFSVSNWNQSRRTVESFFPLNRYKCLRLVFWDIHLFRIVLFWFFTLFSESDTLISYRCSHRVCFSTKQTDVASKSRCHRWIVCYSLQEREREGWKDREEETAHQTVLKKYPRICSNRVPSYEYIEMSHLIIFLFTFILTTWILTRIRHICDVSNNKSDKYVEHAISSSQQQKYD